MHVGISGESSRSLERSDGASGNNGLPVYISWRSDEDCARKSENDRERPPYFRTFIFQFF